MSYCRRSLQLRDCFPFGYYLFPLYSFSLTQHVSEVRGRGEGPPHRVNVFQCLELEIRHGCVCCERRLSSFRTGVGGMREDERSQRWWRWGGGMFSGEPRGNALFPVYCERGDISTLVGVKALPRVMGS